VQKRLATGAFADAEDVIRRALERWKLKKTGPRMNVMLLIGKSTVR
jgi:Arc/MetJ-type ribon-helix-helix transcriptional regulator